MKILSIGNSFSKNAQTYLHGVAASQGVDLYTVNLYFGGCSLEQHYNFHIANESPYDLEINGTPTGEKISLAKAIALEDFDVVTVQQASSKSFDYESYNPYLTFLADYVRANCPSAKLYVHQTWFYEQDSEMLTARGFSSCADMMEKVKSAYAKAIEAISADGIIPSGELFLKLYENGVTHLHCDTFHASDGIGCYALALTWLRALTGVSVRENSFSGMEEQISDSDRATIIRCVEELC